MPLLHNYLIFNQLEFKEWKVENSFKPQSRANLSVLYWILIKLLRTKYQQIKYQSKIQENKLR